MYKFVAILHLYSFKPPYNKSIYLKSFFQFYYIDFLLPSHVAHVRWHSVLACWPFINRLLHSNVEYLGQLGIVSLHVKALYSFFLLFYWLFCINPYKFYKILFLIIYTFTTLTTRGSDWRISTISINWLIIKCNEIEKLLTSHCWWVQG